MTMNTLSSASLARSPVHADAGPDAHIVELPVAHVKILVQSSSSGSLVPLRDNAVWPPVGHANVFKARSSRPNASRQAAIHQRRRPVLHRRCLDKSVFVAWWQPVHRARSTCLYRKTLCHMRRCPPIRRFAAEPCRDPHYYKRRLMFRPRPWRLSNLLLSIQVRQVMYVGRFDAPVDSFALRRIPTSTTVVAGETSVSLPSSCSPGDITRAPRS